MTRDACNNGLVRTTVSTYTLVPGVYLDINSCLGYISWRELQEWYKQWVPTLHWVNRTTVYVVRQEQARRWSVQAPNLTRQKSEIGWQLHWVLREKIRCQSSEEGKGSKVTGPNSRYNPDVCSSTADGCRGCECDEAQAWLDAHASKRSCCPMLVRVALGARWYKSCNVRSLPVVNVGLSDVSFSFLFC